MVSELTGRRAGFTTPQIPPAAYELAEARDCLLEFGVGLALLTGRSLVGSRRTEALLVDEPDWPAAWRVHARALHEGLAAGCIDDLDLVLGIAAGSQRSGDPDSWCSTWWVNESAIATALATADELIELFTEYGAPSVRAVDRSRANAVRTVLEETVIAPLYAPAGLGGYHLPGETDDQPSLAHLSRGALLDPQIPVFAFGAKPHPSDTARFDIDRLVAAHPNQTGESRLPALEALRDRLPVATTVRAQVGAGAPDHTAIREVTIVRAGMPAPDATSGTHVRPGPVDLDDVRAVIAAPSDTDVFVVAGYTVTTDGVPALELHPASAEVPLDPASDVGIRIGDTMVVRTGGRARGGDGDLLTLHHEDGAGRFYVTGAAGLSPDQTDFAVRLTPDAELTATAVPDAGTGHLTATLRPGLWKALLAASPGGGTWHRALVVDAAGGEVVVELATRDDARGIVHRFRCRADQSEGLGALEPGAALEARLRPRRVALPVPPDDDAGEIVAQHPGAFQLEGDEWVPSMPPTVAVMATLEALSSADSWRRQIWEWFDACHVLDIAEFRPADAEGGTEPAVEPAQAPGEETPEARMTVRIPEAAIHRVLAGDRPDPLLLEAGAGASIELDGAVATISAPRARDVRLVLAAVRRRILPARGTVTLAEASTAAAALISKVCEEAGCEIAFSDDLVSAQLSAPTITELRDLLARIEADEPGASGTVTAFVDLEVLETVADAPDMSPDDEPVADLEDSTDAEATTVVEAHPHRTDLEDTPQHTPADALPPLPRPSDDPAHTQATTEIQAHPHLTDLEGAAYATPEAALAAPAEETVVAGDPVDTIESGVGQEQSGPMPPRSDVPPGTASAGPEWWHAEPPPDAYDEWLPPHDEYQAVTAAGAVAGHAADPEPQADATVPGPQTGHEDTVHVIDAWSARAAGAGAEEDHGPDCDCAIGYASESGDDADQEPTSERLRRLLESWNDGPVAAAEQEGAADPPAAAVVPTARPEPPMPVDDAATTWFDRPAVEPADDWTEESDPAATVAPAFRRVRPDLREPEPECDDAVDESSEPRTTPWTLEGEAASRAKIRKGALSIVGGIVLEVVAVAVLVVVIGAMHARAPSSAQIAEAAPSAVALENPSPLGDLALLAEAPAAGCWLAIMGTWQDETGTAGGVARLGAFGMSAAAVPAELVPEEIDGTHAAVVAVATEDQAFAAITRAERLGFAGTAVEAPVATCNAVSATPAGAALGFVDLPTDAPAHEAIVWAAVSGLLAPCNPPADDRFCPEQTASTGDFAAVTDALGVERVTSLAALASVLGVAPPADAATSTPTRAGLASYLWEAATTTERP